MLSSSSQGPRKRQPAGLYLNPAGFGDHPTQKNDFGPAVWQRAVLINWDPFPESRQTLGKKNSHPGGALRRLTCELTLQVMDQKPTSDLTLQVMDTKPTSELTPQVMDPKLTPELTLQVMDPKLT